MTNDSAAASMAFWFASDTSPASATTITSVAWPAAQVVLLLGDGSAGFSLMDADNFLPHHSWKVTLAVLTPLVLLGIQPRSQHAPCPRYPVP